tara:strand:- start:127 stop:474 length:348 start_codon:yes stop_codon:yes gene_type:complete
MNQLDKNDSGNDLANCNLVLMACLFAISASLGTIGSLITSVGYGLYYKYWKPTLYIIPIFLFSMVIISILAYGGFMTTEGDAIGVGLFLSVIPSIVSFLIFRDRILTLRTRKNLN